MTRAVGTTQASGVGDGPAASLREKTPLRVRTFNLQPGPSTLCGHGQLFKDGQNDSERAIPQPKRAWAQARAAQIHCTGFEDGGTQVDALATSETLVLGSVVGQK